MLSTIKLPLAAQVIIGVTIGTLLGVIFGKNAYLGGLVSNETLGQLGMLVIRMLKTLATPLVFLAILDAFSRCDIRLNHIGRLFAICSFNLLIAMSIGLTIMNVFKPGLAWSGQIQDLVAQLPDSASGSSMKPMPKDITLNPLTNLSGYIPENILEPFAKNNIISVILMAVFIGCAIRAVKAHSATNEHSGIHLIINIISAGYQVLLQMLSWIIHIIPFAIAGVVANVVGKSGLEVFVLLSIFLATMLSGLLLHSFVYYPLMARCLGRVPISRYLGQGADAILTGFSTNSSLATVPVTLKCLTEKIGVSERSARLAALVGTNLNNDGVVLYEAMTAIFLAQALGMNLEMSQQLLIIAASVMVGIGVAGIPEAGLVALPLVLNTIGLAAPLIAVIIPLIATIDWIIARCRSVVNVMSDMLVAILLDRFDGQANSADKS